MRLSACMAACAACCALFLSGCGIGTTVTGGGTVKGAAIQGQVMGGRQPISGSKVYLLEAANSYTSHYTQSTLGTGYPFSDPYGLTLDGSGNLYVADYANNAVEEIPLSCLNGANNSTCVVTLGSGFQGPEGVAVDASGNVYVADSYHNLVKKMVAVNGSIPASPTIVTLGSGSVPYTFDLPYGVALDGSGNVYVADASNNAVVEIPQSCIAGANDSTCMKTLGGGFAGPESVTLDRSGNVYVSDTNNHLVKEIPLSCINGANNSGCVKTLGGGYSYPYTVAVDASGNVYVTDPFAGNLVKEIPLSCINGANNSGCVVTLFSGFNNPEGVTLDAIGNFYITDSNNNQVLKETVSYTHTGSKSLLTASTGLGPDSIGYYVQSDSNGFFAINGDYTCDANAQSYIYVLGGDSGSGANSGIGLMASLGQCPGSGTLTYAAAYPHLQVNEVTTVAAAYAMAGYATDATHVSANTTSLAVQGIANTFSNAANLADVTTGFARSATPSNLSNSTVPQNELNTLGNILAACVNTSGPTSTNCTTLFTNAQLNGASGGQPTDTASAAINIAHNPGNGITALYGLQPGTGAVFQPHLSSQPNDFTVGIKFTGNGLSSPATLAIDGGGNVWVGGNSLSEFTASGAVASGSPFSGNGIVGNPDGIAIDASGNVWVSNRSNTVSKFTSSGSASGSSPFSGNGLSLPADIAVDISGNAWVANCGSVCGGSGSGSVSEFTSTGGTASGSPITTNSVADAVGVAMDASGNVWVADHNTSQLSVFTSIGGIASGSPFSGNGLALPFGIAIDGSGNAWLANVNGGVSEFASNGSAAHAPFTGTDLSNNAPITIAIDGSGNAWVGYTSAAYLSEISSAGVVLSPVTGLGNASFNSTGQVRSRDIAIDGSGNVWAADVVNSVLIELVGAATPVVTPVVANLLSPYGAKAVNLP